MFDPSKHTVLIVDDEAELRDAIAFDFQRKGYSVLQAGSGNEALGILEKTLVHVVISDVRMPNGDGIFLLDKIKEKNTALPVVLFITGYTDLSLEDAYDKGADAVFSKPFDRKALFETVQNALDGINDKYTRKFSRTSSELNVGLHFQTSKSSAHGRVKNIGRGGMFVETNQISARTGEEVVFTLEVDLEPKFTIHGTGITRWLRKDGTNEFASGYGIEFLSLDENSNKIFIKIINAIKTKQFIPKR